MTLQGDFKLANEKQKVGSFLISPSHTNDILQGANSVLLNSQQTYATPKYPVQERRMLNLPLVMIHKHPKVFAFSISCQNPHEDSGAIDMILLASQTFQDVYPNSTLHHFGYQSLPAKKCNPLADMAGKSQHPSCTLPSATKKHSIRGFSGSQTMNHCSKVVESSFE